MNKKQSSASVHYSFNVYTTIVGATSLMPDESSRSPGHLPEPIIALNCDGVLLDYRRTYGQIYEKAKFDEQWDNEGWRSMPMHDGALEACHLLHNAGYELVCVTAMPARFIEHRLENFRAHGFPIDRVISSGYDAHNFHHNPKRRIIEELNPVIFVDDLRRNFKDIQGVRTKLIFIDHQCPDDPNANEQIFYHAKYPSLAQFTEEFLHTDQHGQNIAWAQKSSPLPL